METPLRKMFGDFGRPLPAFQPTPGPALLSSPALQSSSVMIPKLLTEGTLYLNLGCEYVILSFAPF